MTTPTPTPPAPSPSLTPKKWRKVDLGTAVLMYGALALEAITYLESLPSVLAMLPDWVPPALFGTGAFLRWMLAKPELEAELEAEPRGDDTD